VPKKPVKIKRKKEEPEFDKDDYQGFRGGIDVNLNRKVGDGMQTLEEVLSKHLKEVLDQEVKNQSERLEKISYWNSMYRGEREERDFPYPNCANVAVPITRSNTDAIHVRLVDALLSQQKLWVFRAKKEEFMGLDSEIEDAMDHYQKHVLDLKRKLNSPLLQSTKIGFGAVKIVYENKTRTRYRYATEKEIKDKNTPTYPVPKSNSRVIKQVESIFKGPNVYPISREDWIASSDATCIGDAYLVGFRKYYRKNELETKARKGFYYEEAVEAMVQPDRYDETKESRAEAQKKEIKQIKERLPYQVWELWMKYDVDEDGEPDDIVVTFHRETGKILRCIYNPLFAGFRPFITFVFYPSEYSLEGEGTCEILEGLQEEVDTLHNQRLDRLTQLNAPMIFVRAGMGLDNFELIPGKVTVIDGPLTGAIEEFAFHDVYYTTEREEDRLVAMADRAVGITPSVMGQSTAERPVAKETFALIQEANKKFKYGIDNLRASLTEMAYMLLEFFAQYQPEYKYRVPSITGKGEQFINERTVDFPLEMIRDGFQVDLAASSEMFNQEARREIAITKYQLLSDYYSKMATVAEAVAAVGVPPQFKIWLVEAAKRTEQVMEEILKEFNDPSADNTVLSIDDVMDIQQVLQPPPPPPTEPGTGGPPPPGEAPPMPGAPMRGQMPMMG